MQAKNLGNRSSAKGGIDNCCYIGFFTIEHTEVEFTLAFSQYIILEVIR